MRILLTLTFFIAFSTFAYAQENKIIVIGEDGTVSSIDIGPSSVTPPMEPKVTPVTPSRPVAATPAKPAKKPAPPKQTAKKETPVKKAAAPKKKTAPPSVPQKQATPAAPASKPDYFSPRPSAAPSRQRLGPQMTPDDAIRLAIDAAPPARSVQAYPVNHNGIHAYQVVFRTEGGDKSLFVDRETGKIVK